MNKNPMISVVMPVYNAGEFLEASVDSIQNQTHQNFELLVIDGGSSDRTVPILEAMSQKDNRIKLLFDHDGGFTSALNLGISAATGDYLARMDGDDLSYRHRFTKQLATFEQNETIAMCSTAVDYTFFKNKVFQNNIIPKSSDEIRIESLFGPIHVHPTVMFDLSRIGKEEIFYREDLKLADDYDLFARVAAKYDTMIIPEPLLLVRRQEHGSLTQVLAKREAEFRLGITARELANAGIVPLDAEAVEILSAQGGLDGEKATKIISWLSAIANYSGYEGQNSEAYRRGVTDFTDVLVNDLLERCAPSLLRSILSETGLDQHLAKYNKLRTQWGSYGAPAIIKASSYVRTARRHLKSEPSNILKDELSELALSSV